MREKQPVTWKARGAITGRIVLAVLLVSATLLLLVALPVPAKDGRDFAGFYKLGEIADLGEEVRVTLTVRVHNYSAADVNDATINLEDSLFPDTVYGRFEHVSIGDREGVRLAGVFIVARSEYDLWQVGSAPHLRILFQDAAGKTAERLIALAPGLTDEEE